jgi:hypothetical protein
MSWRPREHLLRSIDQRGKLNVQIELDNFGKKLSKRLHDIQNNDNQQNGTWPIVPLNVTLLIIIPTVIMLSDILLSVIMLMLLILRIIILSPIKLANN